ncbi:hypothetical protein LTR28_000819 [Elasticomyces elasticus]|nr:hypothetical protein LTR28_000819 [Elasticomyces elasticus]
MDPQAYGSTGWHFPSPSATPTTSMFPPVSFQTPKTASFPTYFRDAFNTPIQPGQSTPSQTPQNAFFPPPEQFLNSAHFKRPQADGQWSEFPGALDHAAYMPLQSQQAAASFPVMSYPASGGHNGFHVGRPASAPRDMSSSMMESFRMQTPPRTRDSSTKRKALQGQQVYPLQPAMFDTPSTIATRRFQTPLSSAASQNECSQLQPSPMQFSQLQFSPDMYHFANFGPATAPGYPRSQSFWMQNSDNNMLNQLGVPDGMLGPSSMEDASMLGWPRTSTPSSAGRADAVATLAPEPFAVQPPVLASNVMRSTSGSMASNQSKTRLPASTGVDPSILYSSQTVSDASAVPNRHVELQSAKSVQTDRQPYEHQLKESRREKESARSRRAQKLPRAETFASMTHADNSVRPVMQRSNTTGNIRSAGLHISAPVAASLNRSNTTAHIPRTSSPLKRTGRTSLSSIPETTRVRPRTSVSLIIDETGRARTETKVLDASPTTCLRDRYPGLWDSDDSESDSDASAHVPSRFATSFKCAETEERRLPKAARLDPAVERLEGLSIPRSSSAASMRAAAAPSNAAYLAAAQLRRQGSARRGSKQNALIRRRSTATFCEASDAGRGCAQDALRDEMMGGRAVQQRQASGKQDLGWRQGGFRGGSPRGGRDRC